MESPFTEMGVMEQKQVWGSGGIKEHGLRQVKSAS